MILSIDNLDYTAALAPDARPQITRKLNRPSQFTAVLVADTPAFVVPGSGGRVLLSRADGVKLFTGYLDSAPEYEYLGWGERGPVYRCALSATSDEAILDHKMLPARAPFVARTAGAALSQLANDLLPAAFDASAAQSVGTLPV